MNRNAKVFSAKIVSAFSLVALLASGCVLDGKRPETNAQPVDANIGSQTYFATDALVESSSQPLDRAAPVLVASLVDIDDLRRSSTLGRMVAEQVSGRLAQLGYHVTEMKLRGSVAIKQQAGELVLSRELKHLGQQHDSQAVVAGTYAVGTNQVHINLRLLRSTDGRVLSAVDYTLPLGQDTRALIPQKHENGWLILPEG
jgi:TolB-like protein